MTNKQLSLNDTLPLTCSRTGTCCHGKNVFINPWELRSLAKAKKISVRDFRDRYCEFGGIRLRFDGEQDKKGTPSCSQYVPNFGCSVHLGRPLACRLYPLGRQKQGEETTYIYQGEQFPCLNGCPEVVDLPKMNVGEYIQGQQTQGFEAILDAYLIVMENIADNAFALLLETGLSTSGDRKTLQQWKKMGAMSPDKLYHQISTEWLDTLILPNIPEDCIDPNEFINTHNELLETKAQEVFGELTTLDDAHKASCTMMSLALHLGHGLGANPADLAQRWIATAKTHGALE